MTREEDVTKLIERVFGVYNILVQEFEYIEPLPLMVLCETTYQFLFHKEDTQ